MFCGEEVVRFYGGAVEADVLNTVRKGLSDLGRVTVDRSGAISIEPSSRSALVRTTLDGRVRKRGREYEVKLTYSCIPTRLGWLLPLFGWGTRNSVADAVRRALRKLSGDAIATDGRLASAFC